MPSLKLDRLVAYESTLERDLFTLIEFDPNVISYEEQPVRIDITLPSGRASRYTPDVRIDFAVNPVDGGPLSATLVEVKYRGDLAKDVPALRLRMRAGCDYARQQGWKFRVVTERHIRTPLLANARFLLGFRKTPPADVGFFEAIQVALTKNARQSVTDLARSLASKEDSGDATRDIWHLVSTFRLDADLNTPLTGQSLVWLRHA
jgi:hypothetical protein